MQKKGDKQDLEAENEIENSIIELVNSIMEQVKKIRDLIPK